MLTRVILLLLSSLLYHRYLRFWRINPDISVISAVTFLSRPFKAHNILVIHSCCHLAFTALLMAFVTVFALDSHPLQLSESAIEDAKIVSINTRTTKALLHLILMASS